MMSASTPNLPLRISAPILPNYGQIPMKGLLSAEPKHKNCRDFHPGSYLYAVQKLERKYFPLFYSFAVGLSTLGVRDSQEF